jgi:hypothetical protein
MLSDSGGIRTHSISRSKREWSADCLPSHICRSCCQRPVPGVGVEPTRAGSRPASLPLADPGMSARVPGGSRTRLCCLGSSCLAARPRVLNRPSAVPTGVDPVPMPRQGTVQSRYTKAPNSLDGWIRTSGLRLPTPAEWTRLSHIQDLHSNLHLLRNASCVCIERRWEPKIWFAANQKKSFPHGPQPAILVVG